jgi:glycosyltransferase involved in cell wall biosynthesis
MTDRGDEVAFRPAKSAGEPRVAVCIPTADRPDWLRKVLDNLLTQHLCPTQIVVVDGDERGTARPVYEQMRECFESVRFVYERAERRLTIQRAVGIDIARQEPVDYICFLDDDLLLAPDFLSKIVAFLETERGRAYGGVCGYDLVGWGQPFDRRERLYARLKIFEDLRPGKWLYCGAFLELTRLQKSEAVVKSDFLPGGLTVWRSEVFDHFRPSLAFPNYSGEDKHFSLRVRARYELGVHAGADAWHFNAPGGRPRRFRAAYRKPRTLARLILECEPKAPTRRFVAFLGFQFVDLIVQVVDRVYTRRFEDLHLLFGTLLGWLSCIIVPPRVRAPRSYSDLSSSSDR